MRLEWNAFALVPLSACVITLLIAIYAWRQRHTAGVTAFAVLALSASVWSFGYIFEILSPSLEGKIFWDNFQFVGEEIIAPAFLLFTGLYTRRWQWRGARAWWWLAIEPALTLLLVFANPWPELIRVHPSLMTNGPFPSLTYGYGGWFWASIIYSYLLLSVGLMFLARHWVRSSNFLRYQVGVALLGAAIPYLGSLLTALGWLPQPAPNLDISSLTFALGFAIMAWGILRFRLLDVLPIAREMVMESLSEGAVVFDTHNQVTDLNRAAQKILGLSTDQILGRNAAEVFRAWPDLVNPGGNGASAHGEISVGEGPTRRYYGLRLSPLQDNWNNVLGWVITLRDITDRKRAETEILRLNKELERRLGEQTVRTRHVTLLNDMTRAALETPDFQTMVQTLADEFREMFNADGTLITQWDAATAHAQPMAASGVLREVYARLIIQPGELTMTESVLQAMRPLSIPDLAQTTYIHPNVAAQLPPGSMLGLPLISGQQKLGAVIISFNQTHAFTPDEIERGEQAAAHVALAMARVWLAQNLAEERGRLEAIIKSTRDGVLFIGMDQHLHVINAPALEFLGLADGPTSWVGHTLTETLAHLRQKAPETVQAFTTELRRIKHGDEPPGEGEYTTAQRIIHWLNLPVLTDTGPLGRLLVLRDVTEQRQIDTMREDLTRAVVHDLRNPLNTINTALYMAASPLAPAEIQQKMLGSAQLSAKKMLGLVNSILNVSRLESGQMPLELGLAHLSTLTAEMIELLMPLAQEKSISLQSQVSDSLPPVRVDLEIIGRVLQNLVGNALKFTPPGGTIEVTACQEKTPPESNQVTIMVSNSGPGIPSAIQNRLFQKFVTGRQEGAGSGLGLAFCRLAVEAHGGRIWVESAPDQLTRFYFTLPIEENRKSS